MSWKPCYRTLTTWTFFKVNNNQEVDLQQSQVMQCVVYHIEVMDLEIFSLCTRCHNGLIAYNKCSWHISPMKHVEQEHAYLLKRFKKDAKFKDEMKQK